MMLKNIIINNLSQGLQFGSRWVLNIVLLKNMSISEFGLFSFLYSISNILSSVLPFGSSIYIFKENNDKGNESLIIDSFIVIFLSFISTIFILLILFLLEVKIKGFNYIIYPILLGLFLSLNIILSSYLKSMNQFIKELKIYFIFSILLFCFIVYVFMQEKVSISQVFQVLIIINFISMIFFIKITSLRFKVFTFKQSILNVKVLFKDRLYYGLQEIQTAISGQSSMIILFYLLTVELYGTYRSLFILIMPLSLISYSMTQVFINYLKKDLDNIKSRFRKILLFSIIVIFLIALFFILFKDFLLDLIRLNNNYEELYYTLLFGTVLKILMTGYISLLVVLDMQKVRFYANLTGASFLLIALFTYVNQTDLYNAILIYSLSILIILFIKIIYGEKALYK